MTARRSRERGAIQLAGVAGERCDGARASRGSALKNGAAQMLVYLTNHVATHVPSYTARHLWYRRILGVDLSRSAGVQLGVQVWFYGPGQVRRSRIRVGDGSRVNRDCVLDCRGGLFIGDHVSVSPQVAIITADHDRDTPGFPLRHGRVVLEDHVWIGMRALILPGVRVGRGAVVAAGAVVTHDVEPGAVVAGVPARTVGRRDSASLQYRLDDPLPLFE